MVDFVVQLRPLVSRAMRSMSDINALTAFAARPLRSSLAIAPAARHNEQALALA